MEDLHIKPKANIAEATNASNGNLENSKGDDESLELTLNKEIDQLDFKSIKEMVLIHEDVSAALSSLPDFGYVTQKNYSDIQCAQTMVKDLRMMLEYHSYTEKKYRETFNSLLKFLREAGVVQCVDDLISVRKNFRSKDGIDFSQALA